MYSFLPRFGFALALWAKAVQDDSSQKRQSPRHWLSAWHSVPFSVCSTGVTIANFPQSMQLVVTKFWHRPSSWRQTHSRPSKESSVNSAPRKQAKQRVSFRCLSPPTSWSSYLLEVWQDQAPPIWWAEAHCWIHKGSHMSIEKQAIDATETLWCEQIQDTKRTQKVVYNWHSKRRHSSTRQQPPWMQTGGDSLHLWTNFEALSSAIVRSESSVQLVQPLVHLDSEAMFVSASSEWELPLVAWAQWVRWSRRHHLAENSPNPKFQSKAHSAPPA